MRQVRATAVVAAILLIAAMAMSQNARTTALGSPNVGGKNLIEDVSDIIYFPSDVSANTDMAQGVASNYVYASKSIFSALSLGLLMNKTTMLTTSGMHGDVVSAMGTVNGVYVDNGAALASNGDFDISSPTLPNNGIHLLLGLKLGDMLFLGADLFREASNYSIDSKDVSAVGAGPTAQELTMNEVGTTDYGTMGLNAGVGLKFGETMSLKLSTGFTMLGITAEKENSGSITASQDGTIPGQTYNREISKFESTSGYYLPLAAKVGLALGANTFYALLNFEKAGYAFKASFDDAVPTFNDTIFKSNEYSMTNMGLGLADEIKVLENTSLILGLAVERNSSTVTPTDVTDANREVTTTVTVFPRTSLGIEHAILNWWKFDKIYARAGGHKTYSWDSRNTTGSKTLIDESDEPNFENFSWYTGLGLNYGNLVLDLAIAPTEYNGVYFLSGEGPAGVAGLVTLTYRFGGSEASSSSAPSSSFEMAPAAPAQP